MAAYKRNPGLGGALTAFRPPKPVYQSNPMLGGALTSFRPRPLAPAASTTPSAGGGEAAPAPAIKTPDPRDSIFGFGVNGLIKSNQSQRDALKVQGEQATQDFNTMLQRMAENRANDLLAQNYNANKQGLFYSGQLGKRRDDVEKGYKQREDDARTSYDRANEARAAALDQLGTLVVDPTSPLGYSGTGDAFTQLAQLYGEAVGRQAHQDASGGGDLAAALSLPAPADQPAATSAPPLAATAPTVTSSGPQATTGSVKVAKSAAHGGQRWVYHLSASGKWIPVRPA